MKIMFIKPPNYGFYHEIERFYPVGLAYLAAACRDAGYEVVIFDSLIYLEDNCVLENSQLSEGQRYKKEHHPRLKNIIRWGASYERIEQKVRDEEPDVVAITAMHTPMYDTAYKVADIVKKVNSDIYVIMGGSHPSIAPEHVIRRAKVDYVLIGEGETSIVKLLKSIEDNSNLVSIDGIAYRVYQKNSQNHKYRNGIQDYDIYVHEKKEWIHNLDELSFPAADLLEIARYDHVTIITSRGCPNQCTFCTVHPTVGKIHRTRSADNVLEEVKYYIKQFGVRVFNFEDDNFSLDFRRANEILDRLIELDEKITLNLPNGITAINLDENMIQKYGKLKMQQSFIGLETTAKDRLKKINKSFTSLDRVAKLCGLFKKYGMNIGASLVVGFPDQTIDQMIEDITELIQRNIEFGTANPCYPIPKSKLYDECLEKGFIQEDSDYTWYDEFNFPLETNYFSRSDIYELWSCSLVYDNYPIILDAMKDGYKNIEELVYLYNNHGFGEMSEVNEGYYCVPDSKNTFSDIMKLSTGNSHSNVFVDTLTGDIIANLCCLFTGENYTCYQTETSLIPNGRVAFFIKKINCPISIIKSKLMMSIHNCIIKKNSD